MPIYKGNTKVVKLYKGTTQIVKRYKGTNIIYSASRLPAEFQEVEYLESTGTQYIDSLVHVNNNDQIEMVFESTQLNITQRFFGGTYNTSGASFGTRSDDNVFMCMGNGIWEYTNINVQTNTKYKISVDNTGLWLLNGITLYSKKQITSSNGFNMCLMCSNAKGIIYYETPMRLFSYIHKNNNGTPVRNFVPCYRKADNVAGLYDLVNGVFYTNAGTGTFIVGGNV